MVIFRIVLAVLAVALSMALVATIPASGDVIFKDRFQPVDKPPLPEPPPITQLTGRAFKGPFRPGSEILLTPLNDDLLQLAPSYRGDVINHQGDYRISALIPQGPVEIQANGYFFNELSNEASPNPLRLQAITSARPEIHVHPLSHLVTQRIRTLVANGAEFDVAKKSALEEVMAMLGFATTTDEASVIDASQMDLDTAGGDALFAFAAILLTEPDGQARDTEAIQVWLTTLREDLADGVIGIDQQTLLVRSSLGALAKADTIQQNLAGVITGTPQNPIVLPALAPLLTHTLEANANRVEITASLGGSVDPSGVQWLMTGETQTLTLSPEVGHELLEVESGCGGTLDQTDPQRVTFTTDSVSDDCVLHANFALKSYAVSIVVPDGAVLTPPPPYVVDHGQSLSFVVTPPDGVGGTTLTGCGGALVDQTYTTAAITAACGLTLSFVQNFLLADNGITVLCADADIGDQGTLNGVTYTKRNASQITAANAETSCTSGITDMSGLFAKEGSFNGDIGHWDTSSVTNMVAMFQDAADFNQDISAWDVSQVSNADYMFFGASSFTGDLSGWCVEKLAAKPLFFEVLSGLSNASLPAFGVPCDT